MTGMEGYEEISVRNERFPFWVMCSDGPERMNAHWHSQIEFMFFYNTDGCDYRCRDKTFRVKSGDLLVANSAEIHECADFGKSSVCCITADINMLDRYKGVRFCNHIQNDERIAAVFDRLKRVYNDALVSEFACAGCIYELFAILLRDYVLENTSERKKKNYINSNETVMRVMLYVKNNVSERLDAGVLASEANLSCSRFYRVFREVTGVTPAEYVERTRISHALCLLLNTQKSISEIAFESGFADHSYFAHRFKKYMGMTPAEYRMAGL